MRQSFNTRYVARRGITMNMFSKLLSLGFVSLLVAAPVVARDHDKKRNCHDKKCSIVGSFIGTIGSQDPRQLVEVQFHEDGTATLLTINSDSSIQFVGAWKCTGHNCFKFCVAQPTGATTSNRLIGEICFTNNDCKDATGTVTIGTAQPTPITLQRVDCCQ